MGAYETMFILNPGLEAEEEEGILTALEAVVKKQGGEIGTVDDWGLRRLSYEIDKIQEGHYFLVKFVAGKEMVPELEHFYRVTDAVIRYIIIREEKQACSPVDQK